jgi:hypothetical protein
MPTQQLQVMVRNLRAECGHSLSVAQGVNQIDTLKYLLARTQEELWTAFVWPDLNVRGNTQMVPGQYLYPFPANMTYDMIRESWTADARSANWIELDYGIEEDRIAPDNTNTWRADPVQAWDVEGNQFRVWPTPQSGGNWVRFKGNRPLDPFTADADVSTLDATVIVLFCAADLLARAKAEDASTKQQKAQRHLAKLLGNKISAKIKNPTLGGGAPRQFRVGTLSRSSLNWYG